MDNIFESISEFIGGLIAIALIGGGTALLAGEIRLATMRKASSGSARLSTFSERMTSTPLQNKGGRHGTRKKSH